MAPKVYLHIGQSKTGSTALQKALARHPAQLAKAGVVYPVTEGRDDHLAEVADLQAQYLNPAEGNLAGYARVRRDAVPGSWDKLVQRVISADSPAIVSNETLSAQSVRLAAQVVDALTDGSPDRSTAVLAVRPLSTLLPSTYAQLAQSTLLPGFELWTRIWLSARIGRQTDNRTIDWTDGHQVSRTWQAVGAEVVCVGYRSDSSHTSALLDALGLAAVRDEIAIPRANSSMSALGLAAWQKYLRGGVDPHALATKRLRKAVRAGVAEVSDANLGGRLSLTPELVELVDAAFPQPPQGTFVEARSGRDRGSTMAVGRLAERLQSGRALTTEPLKGRADDVSGLATRIAELAEPAEPEPR